MKYPKTFENRPDLSIVYGHFETCDMGPEATFEPSEVNGALLLKEAYNDGVKFLNSILTEEEYYVSNLVMSIPEGLKMGQVFDRVPYGIINKTITGLGATTLELMTTVRSSIIVVPTKTLAYSKVREANRRKGEDFAMYIGSPIGDVKSNITINHVKKYIQAKGVDEVCKFVVVADSLPMLFNYLSQMQIDVYDNYFLMVDEIDTMQSDSSYRPSLEAVIDHYFKFALFNRAAVSATIIPFSDPRFAKEASLKIVWDKQSVRDIAILYSNYVVDAAISKINSLLKDTKDKILVAFNSLEGIFDIINQLPVSSNTSVIF